MSWKAMGLAGVAAATLITSTAVMTSSADAHWRGGWGGRGFGGGGFGYRGGYGYRRGFGGGGAIAAGLIGGLALGALAARPAYGYGGGYYGGGYAPAYYGGGYAPAYYGGYGGGYRYAPAYYGGGCTWRTRRVWGPYGPQLVRQRICY